MLHDIALHRIDADIHHLNPLRQIFNALKTCGTFRAAPKRLDNGFFKFSRLSRFQNDH